jgi:hypothetical protein
LKGSGVEGAEGRGMSLTADTRAIEKLLIAGGRVREAEIEEAVAALDDPSVSIMFPLTVAA